MTDRYPITFDVPRPEKFERPQLALRIVVIVALWLLGGALSWILGALYLLLPLYAAITLSGKTAQRFFAENAPGLVGFLRWVLAIYAYMAFVHDRVPTRKPEQLVRFEVATGGTPTVGSALLRILTSIPSAVVLGLLGLVSALVWLIAAVMILIREDYGRGLYGFQLGVLRWLGRLLGYHASLVEQYPPFSLDTESAS